MDTQRRFRLVALALGSAGVMMGLSGIATATNVLIQAEDAIADGASPRRGYAFIDPQDEVANWATIHCSPSPGFPNAPGRFRIDFSDLPPGPYRVAVRIARWGGTTDTTPIPAMTVFDNQGHSRRYDFPTDASEPLGTYFAMRPGGMIPPEGEWAWLPLFEIQPLQGPYELTLIGDPGPAGAGNYKGLWIDAFRFTGITDTPLPPLPEDDSLPGRWEGSFYLSTLSPRRHGISLVFPAEDSPPKSQVLLRRTLLPRREAPHPDHLSLWLQATQRIGPLQVVLKDDRGRQVAEDVCILANDRPLRPGVWYYLLWPFQAHVADGETPDWGRLAVLEIVSATGEKVPEAGLCLHHPGWTTDSEARAELRTATEQFTPAAAASMRCCFAVQDFPLQAVGPEKKVILWALGGYGGQPNATVVRQRISELYPSGADGIVLTVNPIVEGKQLYFADQFLSPRRFTKQHFAAQLADLRAIDWGPLDHSLLRLNVMPGTVDWFDAEWAAVLEKSRLAARLAREGRLAGFMFDVEQYHWDTGIFRYDNRPRKAEKSLAEYQEQARQRGREMGQAVAAEFPGIDILTTFASSLGQDGGELLMPFLEGLAAAPGVHVYDGCEPAYPFRTLRRFLEVVEPMRNASAKIGIGFGLWVNHPAGPFDTNHPEGNYFSPDGLAHALHYALRLSDKYVWLYREQPLGFWPDDTPSGYYEAFHRARQPQDPSWVPPH